MDFDGTLVTKDMLSEVIDLTGKKAESQQLDHDFQTGKLKGLEGLIARINLLKGVTVTQIQDKVKNDLSLMRGSHELLEFCDRENLKVILASGSIVQILEVYKNEIGIDYIVGSNPKIVDGKIEGISQSDYPAKGNFKVMGIQKILNGLDIKFSDCVAIGDGRGDLPMFEMAGLSIAINPKDGIEELTDKVVEDLFEAKEIIEHWINT